VSKNNDPLTILCTLCIHAIVLMFIRYVVWFSGPLGTIWHSCSFYVNLTVFEIFTKNHFKFDNNFHFDNISVHFPKKLRITWLFETYRIDTLNDRKWLMIRAITWRWAGTANLSRLAARGRQTWHFSSDIFLNISKTVWVSSVKCLPSMPLSLNITFYHTTHRSTWTRFLTFLNINFLENYYILKIVFNCLS